MNMKKFIGQKLLFALALALFMLLPAFLTSCNSGNGTQENVNQDGGVNDNVGGNQNAQGNPGEEAGEQEQGTEKIAVTYDVPEMDCGGYTFTAVVRDGYLGTHWRTVDMFAEAENGDPINDAVFRRNRLLEDKFNINITEIRKDDILPYVQKIIQSGSDDFDVCYPNMQSAAALIQKGQLVNLYETPYIDFDKPWWNKAANDSMTVGNKLYGAAGDITTMTNDATWVVLFNKDLNQSFGLGDHYQLVKDGKWTVDVLHENSRVATRDLNGDGVLTPEDQWGTVHQHECAYALFAASGQKVIEKNKDDLPALALNNDKTTAVLSKIIDFMTDENSQLKADDYTSKYANVWDDIVIKLFNESRALYIITNFDMTQKLRNMEANFGILPLPKYNEEQGQYYNTLQYNNATVMCVPVTASDLERTGTILEAWAAESVETLTRAYYDITLKSKHARDDESEDMLDLIFSTRIIDQGLFFNWVGVQGFFEDFSKKKNLAFSSQYEKIEPKWIAAIEKTITAIEENN